MNQKIIDLYDRFTHEGMERRDFMRRLSELAGGTAAASALLPLLEANQALAQTVAEDDPRVTVRRVDVPAAAGELRGYLAVPAGTPSTPFREGEGRPGVVVIHENRGLNAHIEDVTRRLAAQGFVALAPDFLSILGGTPTDPDRARELIGQLETNQVVIDSRYAIEFVSNLDTTSGMMGVMGFCWGGGIVGRVVVDPPQQLDAAVVFYGRVPPLDMVDNINVPLLLHYAGEDQRINQDVPAFREALDEAGKTYELHMYEGVNHAFHNDTSQARYDEDAAKQAWQRTLDFFNQHLTRET